MSTIRNTQKYVYLTMAQLLAYQRSGVLATGGTLLLDMDGATRLGRGSAGGLGGTLSARRGRRGWWGFARRTSG
jgi:hypothetical protein